MKALLYYYDQSGICGFNYDGADYYYRKNLQGDIIAIYESSGTLRCTYTYDAWGNMLIHHEDAADLIGYISPFRYRGYYFDDETQLYYLQSRYYDPVTGRFLNADKLKYAKPLHINGLNLYSYCANNPIRYVDPEGTSFWDWFAGIGSGFAVIGGAILIGTGVGAGLGAILITTGLGGLMGGITNAASGGSFAAGAAGGAVSGLLIGTGLVTGNAMLVAAGGKGALAALGFGIGAMAVAGGLGFAGGALGSAITDIANGNPVDKDKALLRGALAGALNIIALPFSMVGSELLVNGYGYASAFFGGVVDYLSTVITETVIWFNDWLEKIRG